MVTDPADTSSDPCAAARVRMVTEQIERRGVRDQRVLAVLRTVPRHVFVPEDLRHRAHEDGPLPIGEGQTISQPYIVAFMTEAIRPGPADRVLEVGTGSGYQTAVLASLVAEVFTMEIRPDLAEAARSRIENLGLRNVRFGVGDGSRGWPEHAPYDGILVTAAPGEVPRALEDELAPGGRLVIPIGVEDQQLIRITRTEAGLERDALLPVRFVPLTGEPER